VLQDVLAEMLPEGWSNRVMGRMVEMDDRMDAKGYLRLCTRQQTMRLMGNAITEEVAALAAQAGLSVDPADVKPEARGVMSRLAAVGWIRYILQGIVNRIYRWLN